MGIEQQRLARGSVLRLLTLGLCQTACAVGQVLLMARIVDGLSSGSTSTHALLALGALVLTDAALRRAEAVGSESLGQTKVRDVRVALFEHSTRLGDLNLGDLRRGGILLRFLGDLTPLRQWIALAYVRLPIAALTLVAGLAAIATNSPAIAGAVGLVLVLGALVAVPFAGPLYRRLALRRRLRNRLAANVAEKIHALPAIRACAREARELERVRRGSEGLLQASMAFARTRENLRTVLHVTLGGAALAALAVGAEAVSRGMATTGDVFAALALIGILTPALRELTQLLEVRQGVRLTRERLAAIEALPTVARSDRSRHEDGTEHPPLQLEKGEAVPHGLVVRAGEHILVEGGEPAERARFLKMLAGLEVPEHGQVKVHGQAAHTLRPADRRRWLGYAAEDLPLISGSVSKNLRYRHRKASAEEMTEALEWVGLGGGAHLLRLEQRISAMGRDLHPRQRAALGLARALLGWPALVVVEDLDGALDSDQQTRLLAELQRRGVCLATGRAAGAGDSAFVHRVALEQTEVRDNRSGWARVAVVVACALLGAPQLVPTAWAQEEADNLPAATADDGGWSARYRPGGLEITHGDADLSLRLGGRFHLDAGVFTGNNPRPDEDIELRRARVSLALRFQREWRALVDYDFGRSEGVKNLWLRWQGESPWQVTAGAHQSPFSMEEVTSSNHSVFLERSLANALTPGYLVGLSGSWREGDSAFGVGLFGDSLENEPRRRAQGFGAMGRGTTSFLRSKENLVHVGASVELRDVESGSRFRLRTRPETALGDQRLVDTRTLDGVDFVSTAGAEFAWRHRRLLGQAEWIASHISLPDENPTFSGGYAQVSGFLTDHDRSYSARRGRFANPDLDPGEQAFELGLRFSHLDLTDGAIEGGVEHNLTLGGTWYLGPHVRVLSNAVLAFARPDRDGRERDLQIWQLRLQWVL